MTRVDQFLMLVQTAALVQDMNRGGGRGAVATLYEAMLLCERQLLPADDPDEESLADYAFNFVDWQFNYSRGIAKPAWVQD